MISCGLCEQFKSGVCPIGTPWRRMESCIFKVDAPEIKDVEEILKNMDKNTRDKKIFEEYKAGVSIEDLHERYGLAISTLHKILRSQGRPRRKRMEFSEIDVDTKTAILLSLDDGDSITLLSKEYDISPHLIRKIREEDAAEDVGPVKVERIVYEKEDPIVIDTVDTGYGLGDNVTVNDEDIIDIDITVSEPEKKLTFLIAGDLLKPFENCYATEYEKRLIWAIDIYSLEDLSALIDKADGSLVIDGQFMDIIPVSIRDKK